MGQYQPAKQLESRSLLACTLWLSAPLHGRSPTQGFDYIEWSSGECEVSKNMRKIKFVLFFYFFSLAEKIKKEHKLDFSLYI